MGIKTLAAADFSKMSKEEIIAYFENKTQKLENKTQKLENLKNYFTYEQIGEYKTLIITDY